MIRWKQHGWSILAAFALAACSAGVAADQAEVATGTALKVSLDQTLTSERHSSGSEFGATVQTAVYDNEGLLLIPAGSPVQGKILTIQEDPPRLQLELTSITVRGESSSLDASLIEFAPAKHSEMKDEGKKIGGGAAVGAVVGGIVGGDVGGAAVGAIAGAAAGTGVALLTKDSHIFVPAGSVLEVELHRALTVPLDSPEEPAAGTSD